MRDAFYLPVLRIQNPPCPGAFIYAHLLIFYENSSHFLGKFLIVTNSNKPPLLVNRWG